MEDLRKIKKDIEALSKQLACLYLLTPAATRWTPNHNSIYGDQYKPGVLVWYNGFIYKCKIANNSSSINNTYFWEKLRPGLLLEEEQTDWDAAPDRTAYLRNKPTKLSQFIDDIGAGGITEELDPVFQAWLDSNPLAPYYLASNPAGYITAADIPVFMETDPEFNAWLLTNPLADYYLASNPDGFISSEDDPVFQAWLASNPLVPYLLSSVAATTYYPLVGNPSGFLTQQTVLEYPDLAAIMAAHPVGISGVVYIANNVATTGIPVYYIWNGSSYVTDTIPVTGITGSGTINTIPKFLTPTSIGNSLFTDNGINGYYGPPNGNHLGFLVGGNIWLRLSRGGNNLEFRMGNSGIGQFNDSYSTNTLGYRIGSRGLLDFFTGIQDTGEIRALRIQTTGQLEITQTPATGVNTDMILVREVATGALRQISIASLGAGTYLPLSGGTMTGDIVLSSSIPTNALNPASKSYVDNLITGITWKNSVRVATTANITLSGTQTIDGTTVIAGNRVLIKNQTTTSDNGIYIVSAGAWTRAVDCDSASELESSTVLVMVGTANKNTQWTQSLPINTIGTDPVSFVQIAGAGVYTNGSGITLTGNVFSIAALAITNSMINDVTYSKITGVPIGSVIQGWDADLDAIAALVGTSGLLRKTGTNTWTLDTNTYLTAITSLMVTTALGFTPVASNAPISAATKTKISYDSKGLVTNGADATTDDIAEGATRLYFTPARVLASLLTGLSLLTGGPITAGDSVLIAFGKLQKQITDILAGNLSQFGATTSAQLAGIMSDETGTGALVFANTPTLVNPIVGTQAFGDSSTKAASTAFVQASVNYINGSYRKTFLFGGM